MVRLQCGEIRLDELLACVGSPADGAVALFIGRVRDHNRERRVLWLEYEAYPEMAETEMARLVREAGQRFEVSAIALVHRIGKLAIGEASVAVAVAAPHRGAAFDACRFVIETLKRTVPIWKKEVFEGGEAWIEGPACAVDPQA